MRVATLAHCGIRYTLASAEKPGCNRAERSSRAPGSRCIQAASLLLRLYGAVPRLPIRLLVVPLLAVGGCVVPHVGLRAGPIVDSGGFQGGTFTMFMSMAPEPFASRRIISGGFAGRIAEEKRDDPDHPEHISLVWLLDVDGAVTVWQQRTDESRPRLVRATAGVGFGAGPVSCHPRRVGTATECPDAAAVAGVVHVGIEAGQIERGGTPAWFGLFGGAGIEIAILASDERVVQISPYVQVTIANARLR